MAQATKMGADTATLEARRKRSTGHCCSKCGEDIAQGDLMMVRVMAMDAGGRSRTQKVAYHRKCYGLQ
jgi:hypothetical protein